MNTTTRTEYTDTQRAAAARLVELEAEHLEGGTITLDELIAGLRDSVTLLPFAVGASTFEPQGDETDALYLEILRDMSDTESTRSDLVHVSRDLLGLDPHAVDALAGFDPATAYAALSGIAAAKRARAPWGDERNRLENLMLKLDAEAARRS